MSTLLSELEEEEMNSISYLEVPATMYYFCGGTGEW